MLEHVNVTSTEDGIKIEGRIPRMTSVLSQLSEKHGIDIKSFYDPRQVYNPEIFKATLVKNGQSGIKLDLQYPTKVFYNPKVTISGTISTSNSRHGVEVSGRGFIHLSTNTYFHNAHDGFLSEFQAGTIISRDDLSASNQGFSMKFSRSSTNGEFMEIQVMKCNMTGHFSSPVIHVDVGPSAKFSMDRCQFFQNYNGGLRARNLAGTELNVWNNNFTRNRGRMIQLAEISESTKVNIRKNLFNLNMQSSHTERQAAVEVAYGPGNPETARVILAENQFLKNTYSAVFAANDTSPRDNGILHVQGNSFKENLVLNTAVLDIKTANATYNSFDNPGANCEVITGNLRQNSAISAQNNFWAQSNASHRACGNNLDSRLSPISSVPTLTEEGQIRGVPIPSFKDIVSNSIDNPDTSVNSGTSENLEEIIKGGGVGANLTSSGPRGNVDLGDDIGGTVSEDKTLAPKENPYQATHEIVVGPGTKLILFPGTTVLFAVGTGLRVSGKQ